MAKGNVSGRILFSLGIRWLAVLTVLAMAVVLSACTDSPAPTPAAGTGDGGGRDTGATPATEAPGATWVQAVSAGGKHTCGVRVDGSVDCWGDNEHGQSTLPEGEFASVSAGWVHTCGVRADGSVACWGNDSFGQSTLPEGSSPPSARGGATPAE